MGAQESSRVTDLLNSLEANYGKVRFISRFDPMEELVSCILSQSSSDSSSFPAFTRLLEKYGDWESIAKAPQEEVAAVILKAGLANQKSKSIQACLKEISERNGGYHLENLRTMEMLEARKWLQSLPGVGPKTGSIVLCFSFGMGAIPVDTHVFRVSWRLALIDQKIGENKAHDALLELVPPEDAFRFHTLLIQHGRHLCKAQNPNCLACPQQSRCPFFLGHSKSKSVKASNRNAPRSRTNK